jgi:hypothetical protein
MHWRPLALAVALLASAGHAADDARCELLFALRRSTNRNEVVYEACFRGSAPAPQRPVRAHWRIHESDGHREELTALEDRFAYGVSASAAPDGAVTFALRPAPGRRLTLLSTTQGARAALPLRGEPCALLDVYVQLDEGGLVPSVRYVELSGVSLRTGAPFTERLER